MFLCNDQPHVGNGDSQKLVTWAAPKAPKDRWGAGSRCYASGGLRRWCISLAGLENGTIFVRPPQRRRCSGCGRHRLPAGASKISEAAQFNAVSLAQRRFDRAQDRVDETLNITRVETRILRGDAVDKLGVDHRVVPPRGYRPHGMAVPDSGRVVRFVASICSRRQPQQFASIGVELPGLTARSQSFI